jgi:hypothetical protein
MRHREGLSRKSIKNLYGIARAIFNFQWDEMAQSGKPVLSPWLVGRRSHHQRVCSK